MAFFHPVTDFLSSLRWLYLPEIFLPKQSAAFVEPSIPRVNEAGLRLIKLSEGYRAKPYYCAGGICTIGFGTTMDADFKPVTMGHPTINLEIATELFERDIAIFSAGVLEDVKVEINDNQLSAMTSLAYNIGQCAFSSSTLLRKLNRGDYQGCASEFWKWRRADGRILSGLVKRRALEKELFLS